ncbi:hypothetical protein AB3R30_07245 [Leptolyngbyaceae cyanobacterium UHCC 1019]
MSNHSNGSNSLPEMVDPLVESSDTASPDRLYYATGVLLDAEDFQAEQLYHRSRLARSLAYLQGGGTLAGLRVRFQPDQPATTGTNPQPAKEEEVIVEPGLALDRLGRLIEVPKPSCIRLKRWLVNQRKNANSLNVHTEGSNQFVIADVFLRFVPHERGRTPAFAAGAFDALDAVAPSRIRDSYELKLILRQEDQPQLPQQPWHIPDSSAASSPPKPLSTIANSTERWTKLRDLIFDSWQSGTQHWEHDNPNRLPEQGDEKSLIHPTSLFLARFKIPVSLDSSGKPVRTTTSPELNNDDRVFVYTTGAISSWLGIHV